MKRVITILAAAALTAACDRQPAVAPGPYTGDVDMTNVQTTRLLGVEVEEGHIAVVQSGDEVIATASQPTVLYVPSHAPVEVRQLTPEEFNRTGLEKDTYQLWQVVAFEDSRRGDYDYNDLVVHVKYESRRSNWYPDTQVVRVAVHPVALGSTKPIALGYDVYAGAQKVKTEMVASDCRKELFGGMEGMLNTLKRNFTCDRFVYKNSEQDPILCPKGQPISINWFIVVDGDVKLHALSTVHTASMIDPQNRPYGLVTTRTGYQYTQDGGVVGLDWFNYPKENVAIDEVYPDFGRWLRGEYAGSFQSMYRDDSQQSFDAAREGVYELSDPRI